MPSFTHSCFFLFLSAFLAGSYPLQAQSQTGTITGRVELPRASSNQRIAIEKYSKSISEKVAPPPAEIAGVWLTAPQLSAPSSPPPVVLEQKNYQFGKNLIIIPTGTKVLFPNEDPDYHNIFSLSREKRFDLGRYKKDSNPVPFVVFDKVGLIKLRCEIHEHMRALALVVDTPYYTVSNQQGAFRFTKIPVGNYTLHALSDDKTYWKTPVTVTSNRTTTLTLPLSQKSKE